MRQQGDLYRLSAYNEILLLEEVPVSALIVGLTGGIGSGKSAASECFAAHGIGIVDADVASRVVVAPGRPALERIKEHFGEALVDEHGELDRTALRSIVFADPEERKWLEALLHPLIYAEIVSALQSSTTPYTILSSPLLLEAGQNRMTNRVVVVDVPVEMQLERTLKRDHSNATEIQRIIDSQMSRAERLALADDVIDNSGTLDALRSRVSELHNEYLKLAAEAEKS